MTSGSTNGNYSDHVVIVGAGGCGLVAALAASGSGAKVLLLEKAEIPGGNTNLTTAVVVAGSRFQREAGVEDDPALFAQDINRRNQGQGTPALVELMAHEGASVLEWIADHTGLEFIVPRATLGLGATFAAAAGPSPASSLRRLVKTKISRSGCPHPCAPWSRTPVARSPAW
jgi:succinate dehydrogenase/fumarate reductase flavoprotein subunit